MLLVMWIQWQNSYFFIQSKFKVYIFFFFCQIQLNILWNADVLTMGAVTLQVNKCERVFALLVLVVK